MPSRTAPYRPNAPVVAELSAGTVLLSDAGDKTLLLHEPVEDRWCFPKGHVDAGESLAEAALRESREETGLTDIRLGPEVEEVSYRFYRPEARRNVHKTTVYFVAHAREERPRPEATTFDRAEWVDFAKARELVKFPADREVLDAVVRAQKRAVKHWPSS